MITRFSLFKESVSAIDPEAIYDSVESSFRSLMDDDVVRVALRNGESVPYLILDEKLYDELIPYQEYDLIDVPSTHPRVIEIKKAFVFLKKEVPLILLTRVMDETYQIHIRLERMTKKYAWGYYDATDPKCPVYHMNITAMLDACGIDTFTDIYGVEKTEQVYCIFERSQEESKRLKKYLDAIVIDNHRVFRTVIHADLEIESFIKNGKIAYYNYVRPE